MVPLSLTVSASLQRYKVINITMKIRTSLLLSCFSCVWVCVTPETAAHQAAPSLGFSRQEHWSGLPFPSPMHESGKWKLKLKSLSRIRLLATPWNAAQKALPSMGFPRQEYWSGVPLPSLVIYTTLQKTVWKDIFKVVTIVECVTLRLKGRMICDLHFCSHVFFCNEHILLLS